MRKPRLKLVDTPAIYHCGSHLCGGAELLQPSDRTQFERLMWAHARFCGLQIINHCVMHNHFHLVIFVPASSEATWSDEVAVQRVREFYSEKSPFRKRVEASFEDGKLPEKLRQQLQARTGDISIFMKELKQRFSGWFNQVHGRFGTLWADRFYSAIVEEGHGALGRVSRYVDLNPVRHAGIGDPADYEWSGYGRAVRGHPEARAGLMRVMQMDNWEEASRQYRMALFLAGGVSGHSDKMVLDPERIRQVLKEGGQLTEHTALLMELPCLIRGGVIGSEAFVEGLFNQFRELLGVRQRKQAKGSRPLRGVPFEGLHVLNIMRKPDIELDLK